MLQRIVWLLPRNRLLSFISATYLQKYNNHIDTNPHSNGEKRWLAAVIATEKAPVVFDIGANTGDWTALAQEVNPEAMIHAFEPFPATFERLAKRFAHHPRVILSAAAAGAQEGELELKISTDADEHNSFHGRTDRQPDSVLKVPVVTVDGTCQKLGIARIHFLKIDTEGHELAVLKCAQTMLRKGLINAVQFEYGNNYVQARVFLKDIFDFAADLPYDLYRVMPDGLRTLPGYHTSLENFQYANYAMMLRRQVPAP